jgi:DivIVA domain-containing protein
VPLSPRDIEAKEFLVTLRGYDKDEVRAFLSAVASDYREARKEADPSGKSSELFEALGAEVSHVLQAAQEAAEGMRRKAEEEIGALRKKGEAEAQSLRDSAAGAAQEVRAEAERYAVEARARADREAADRLKETLRRVEVLQATEQKVRQSLHAMDGLVRALRQELETKEEAPKAEREAGETVPAPGQNASGEQEAEPSEEKSDSQIRAV